MDVCAVCTADLDEAAIRLPGCGHRFHLACALTFAQYDCRCPMCRAVPEGVALKKPNAPPARPAPRDHVSDYLRRRRHAIRDTPGLGDLDRELRRVRGSVIREYLRVQRTYDACCQAVWREHPDVVAGRRAVAALRQREARLTRRMCEELDTVLGPELHLP